MVHHWVCCVFTCSNNGKNSSCSFYSFPKARWRLEQRNKWIEAVARINVGASPWIPKECDRICSEHFVGGRKSERATDPGFAPSIFIPKLQSATSLILQTDDSDGSSPALVPEKRELSNDVPTFSKLTAPQVVPIEPFVPQEVDGCEECSEVIDRCEFWCVQCSCGPLCGACAAYSPHDAHYVLRAPMGATHSHTQAVLAVIREQLRNDNLLTLFDFNETRVKVEVKLEPEDFPPPEHDPSMESDPLAMACPVQEKSVEEEALDTYLSKRRRLMECMKPDSTYAEKTKSLIKRIQPNTTGSQNVPKTTASDVRGSQSISKPKPTHTVLKIANPKSLKLQDTPNLRVPQTFLKVKPSDVLIGSQTVHATPSGSQTAQKSLKIKRTLLKVPLSELTKSKTLSSDLERKKFLRNVKPSELLKLKKVQNILKSTAVSQTDPKGQKLHNVLKGFSTPLKVTSEPPRRSDI